MASYSLSYKPSIEKDFRAIPQKTVARIFSRIQNLRLDPFPQGVVKLEGAERLYRLRVGDYRVVYEVIRDERAIIIHYVRHRRDVYRNLK